MTSRSAVFGASVISILWGSSACSSSTNGATDASVDAPLDAGKDTATDGPRLCNMVTNGAPVIAQQYAPGDPPAPSGGTIVDGTYFVTAATIFTADAGATGPTGALIRETDVISGTTFQIASGSLSQTGSFTTNGTAIAIAITCPPGTPAPPFVAYDANGRVITVYSARNDAGVTASYTFTKQ